MDRYTQAAIIQMPPLTLTRNQTLIHRWVPLVAWMLAIFYISARPVPPSPIPITHPLMFEAAFHVVEYFGLAILMHRALSPKRWQAGSNTSTQASGPILGLLITGAVSSGYAVSDELHQHFVPGRAFQLIDFVVDAIGIAAALAVLFVWLHRRSPKLRAGRA